MAEIWVGLSHKPISFFKKSAGVGLWPPARRAYDSERYSGSTYSHLSDTGSWESVQSIQYSGAFGGALDLGGGLVFISHNPRCLSIFFTCPPLPLTPYHKIDPSFHFPKFVAIACHGQARQAGHLFILYKTNDSHLTMAFRACQGINLPP